MKKHSPPPLTPSALQQRYANDPALQHQNCCNLRSSVFSRGACGFDVLLPSFPYGFLGISASYRLQPGACPFLCVCYFCAHRSYIGENQKCKITFTDFTFAIEWHHCKKYILCPRPSFCRSQFFNVNISETVSQHKNT